MLLHEPLAFVGLSLLQRFEYSEVIRLRLFFDRRKLLRHVTRQGSQIYEFSVEFRQIPVVRRLHNEAVNFTSYSDALQGSVKVRLTDGMARK